KAPNSNLRFILQLNNFNHFLTKAYPNTNTIQKSKQLKHNEVLHRPPRCLCRRCLRTASPKRTASRPTIWPIWPTFLPRTSSYLHHLEPPSIRKPAARTRRSCPERTGSSPEPTSCSEPAAKAAGSRPQSEPGPESPSYYVERNRQKWL
ncbi:hypothetical protein N431DRAFT_54017, partial [Stipitochalara longipes BDJ]